MALTDTVFEVNTVLKAALKMVENSNLIALDIETTGLDPRVHSWRLSQVSNGEETYVIDMWREVDARSLFEALARTETVVTHGGDFEWRWIYHHYGIALDDIKDTFLLRACLVRVRVKPFWRSDVRKGLISDGSLW